MTSAAWPPGPGQPVPRPGWRLTCFSCSAAPAPDHVGRCPWCRGPVLAERDRPMVPAVQAGAPGIWRYAGRLGLRPGSEGLSIGEGGTPLIADPATAHRVGVRQVWLKLDSLCPTGSFKDRAVAAGVEQAVVAGATGLVCASSGNAAASTAAYGARAGLPAILVMPEHTPVGKLAASAAYGATQVLVPGDYSNSYAVAEQLAAELHLANVTTTYLNPHAVVGLRTVAYELAEQLPDDVAAVVVPTSSGPLVHGVHTGFQDLVAAGLTSRVPRLVAAQPAGCAPVATALAAGAEHVEAWGRVTTNVSGLDDPLRGYASDGTVTLRAVRTTGGTALGLADELVETARDLLARESGIFVEPAGAISVAALADLVAQGHLGPDDDVVCLLTGHGMKRTPGRVVEPIRAGNLSDVIAALSDRGVR